MPWIGTRRLERVPQLAHWARRVEALLPRLSRVGQEALEAVHRRLPVLRPQAARSTKGRDTALHGQTGSRERDGVARSSQALGRRLERFEALPVHAAAPCVIPPPLLVNG